MKLHFNYLEHEIDLRDDSISVLEVENKSYFYRIVNDLFLLNVGETEEVRCYDGENEVVLENKIHIVVDFFNFDSSIKKYLTSICKNIEKELSEAEKLEIIKKYAKFSKEIEKAINKFDFSIRLNGTLEFEKALKFLNAEIEKKESIFENLILLIDLEKTLRSNKLIVFINLKNYLTKNELIELYKYAIYNDVRLLLVDANTYGIELDFEEKLIIDSNLDEFMI